MCPTFDCFSIVFQDSREAEVHVQLLVAFAKRVTGIVSREVQVDGLERHRIDPLLVRVSQFRLAELCYLKDVQPKMDRMPAAVAVEMDEPVSGACFKKPCFVARARSGTQPLGESRAASTTKQISAGFSPRRKEKEPSGPDRLSNVGDGHSGVFED